MTTPPPSGTPSPGFDLRIETRLPPDGKPKLELDPGKRHEIVVHVPGGEAPGATVPEAGKATGGLSLPKLGEKWSTAAPTGQGSVSIVLPLPTARGASPMLALTYTTAGGNGPFGWGWRGPVPYFTRTTTKAVVREHARGVPEYDDAAESDVFLFSDADELVKSGEAIDPSTGAVVVTYRARTEGAFARIERHELAGRSHFVVHAADASVSIFGQCPESAVADPADPNRVFQWFLQEQRDALGNVAVYRYEAEDLDGVDTNAGSERARGGPQPQRYLKRILYGNRDVPEAGPIDPASLDDEAARARWMFEVVFDYGEHAEGTAAGVDDDRGWPVRADAFSSGRAGFEIRTRRLCRRVLVFHRFTQLAPDAAAVLTRSFRFGHDEDVAGSRLVSVTHTAIGDEGSNITLPPRRFTYAPRTISATTRTIEHARSGELELAPPFVDAELFDLHGDGEAGLLTRENGRFVFRRRAPDGFSDGDPIPFAATPSQDPSVHLQRWLDVGAGGLPALVEFGPSDATVFARDADGVWQASQVAAGKTPPVGKDPKAERHRIYLADLDGDGITDVLVARESGYVWWRRMGAEPGDGWEEQPPIEHDGDEERGPGPVLFDAARDLAPEGTPRTEAIVLADMTGDGLLDIVRVRADEIAYWPSLGRGRFGGKIVLGAGPGEPIDETCVRACDIDGLGPASLLLLRKTGGGTLWLNACGNRLAPGPTFATPPLAELALSSLGRIDGSTTASFVWAEKGKAPVITIVDLVAETPWLLVRDENGAGARTTIRYGTAAAHARRDAAADRPWRTRLPVAVSVVDGVIAEDLARGTRFATSYRYSHGHWDAVEREFRGFAFVEQRDGDEHTPAADGPFQTSDASLGSPPMRTRSWFFVGAEIDLQHEYDRSDPQAAILPPPDLSGLAEDDAREAARALRGVTLRTERYSDDGDPAMSSKPWVTSSQGWIVRIVQAKGSGHHASVLALAEQTLTYTDERGETSDPRLVQTAVVDFDDLGFATRTATVAYPRRKAVPEPGVVPPKPADPDPGSSRSVLLRVVDFAFDTDKSFVLPQALPGLAVLKAQCAAQVSSGSGGAVLILGHTDRTGAAEDNLGISLQRARRVVEYLRGDVDGWLLLFDGSMPASIRWGAHEEGHMLAALGHGGDVLGFQASVVGLGASGVVDDATRRALIERYMARTGSGIPASLPMHAVGAGEGFVVEATADGAASAANRRIEAFVFGDAITPPAPDKFLTAGAPEYATWIARAIQRAEVEATTGAVTVEGVAVAAPLSAEPRPASAESQAPSDDPQRRTVIVVHEVDLVHQQELEVHRLGTAIEQRTFEVTGKPADPAAPFAIDALRAAATGGATIPCEQRPSGAHERRLIARARQTFYDDDLVDEAPPGAVGKRALPAKSKAMAFSDAQAAALLDPMMVASRADAPAKVLAAGGYVQEDGGWWAPSSRVLFSAEAFYQPVATIDPSGTVTQTLTYDRDHYLVVRRVTEPAGGQPLMSSTSYEYRSFGARGSFEPNGSATIRHFDAMGRVTSELRRGDPSGGETEAPEDAKGLRAADHGSEGDDDDAPTIVFAYDDHAFVARGTPCSFTQTAKLEYGGRDVRVSLAVTYVDGTGGVLQTKTRTADGRWRSSGRTVVNDRGLAVLQFGPWLSDTPTYDAGSGQLLARVRYDALDRPVRTEFLDGSFERVVPGAWESTAYDRNDTVLESEWLAANQGASGAHALAAQNAVAHADTPTTTRLDALGRPIAVFQRFVDDTGAAAVIVTRTQVWGNVTEVIDARGNVAETSEHGMLGQVLRTRSVDAGESRAIADVLGAPLRAVDARGNIFYCEYDGLRRPIEDWVAAPGPSGGQVDILLAKRVFGDGENDGKAGGTRQRGRLVRVFDGGGMTSIDAYDLDGNATATTRRLVDLPRVLKTAQLEGRPARACTDWSALGGITSLAELDAMLPTIDLIEDKTHRATTRYDARGRAIETTLPLSGSTHRTRYTEDGLLQRIERETAAGTREPVYEADEFDHLGRPLRVRQGDAVRTAFTYDVITERLLRLQTTASGRALQDLHYAYDPVGNITQVRDGAQAVVFRDNAELAASNDYRYDALYRLVEATGREHEGQAANGRTPRANDAVVVPLRSASPSDPKAMRRYVQRYRYDAVGNLTTLQHFAGAGSYRRESAYSDHGNRLRATGNAALALHERYEHDVAGHMVAMPHLSRLQWDELGQLEYVCRGTQHVWLQYAGGARVRKLVFSGEGVVEDRVYLGAEEMYTKRRAGAVVEQTLTEHAGGGLSVDIKLVADGKAVAKPVGLRRYAVVDHLGSWKLEVDPDGKVIAYEEFHPYGTTSYRAMRSGLDAAANRYRFTGMERDEETGLAQHGARYYAGWLGRWVSADPIGIGDGVNRFAYCRGSPVGSVDTDGCESRLSQEHAYIPYEAPLGASDYVFEDESVQGASSAERFERGEYTSLLAQEVDPGREERIAGQQAGRNAATEYLLRGGGLEHRIREARSKTATLVALATLALVAAPFVIEGGIAFAGYYAGSGSVGTAAYLAAGELSAATAAFAAQSTIARVGIATAEAAGEASSVAEGAPPTLGVGPGRAARAGQAGRGAEVTRLAGAPVIEVNGNTSLKVDGVVIEIGSVNPAKRGPRCENNCVNSALALDATLGGSPASALARPKAGDLRELLVGTGRAEFDLSTASLTEVEDLVRSGGPGTHGIVAGLRVGTKGHAFNVLYTNDVFEVVYVCGQAGTVYSPKLDGFSSYRVIITRRGPP